MASSATSAMLDSSAASQPIRRRCLKFRLRALLLLMTLVCIWLGLIVSRAHRQRAAVAAILEAGGSIRFAHEPSREERVAQWLSAAWSLQPESAYEPPGPRWLRRLIGDEYFQTVVEVRLAGLRWGGTERRLLESQLWHIASLKNLERLDLSLSDLSDDWLRQISRLTHLNDLNLRATDVTDAGLVHLRSLRRLEHLNVINTWVTAEGVADFRRYVPNCVVATQEPPELQLAPDPPMIYIPVPTDDEVRGRSKRSSGDRREGRLIRSGN